MSALPARCTGNEFSFDGLQSLIEITEQMLVKAKAGAWDELKQLEREQRRLAEQTFVHEPPEGQGSLLAQGLEFLLGLNAEVTAVIRDHRRQTAEKLITIQAGRRAKLAYSE
jgi:hypothetical protein